MNKKHIIISPGDPAGIGPECLTKALLNDALRARARYTIVAPPTLVPRLTNLNNITIDDPGHNDFNPHQHYPTKAGGEASHRWVERAIELAKALPADEKGRGGKGGLVTLPISKQAWHLAGHTAHPGHTELLADRFNASRTAMMFFSPQLIVTLATVHVPLRDVPKLLTTDRVLECIELTHEALVRMGHDSPQIHVAGLNPHAGEGGLLGDEDDRIVAPAVQAAQQVGIDAIGPAAADTMFTKLLRTEGDTPGKAGVVMYHDQGLVPVKLIARDQAVNVTLGLPIVRTSPAHGTAYDIAGQNIASPASTIAAINAAIELAGPC